jgi:hypothetical protein
LKKRSIENMCGIVGYISTEDDLHGLAKRHFADYALMLDTLRGADSTGIIRVKNEFDVHVNHTTMGGRKYVHTKPYDDFMSGDSWAFIGHNRAATAGSVKLENAHPFTFGDVTMVHNGTLTSKGTTMPGYDAKLEVDSMQIARALSEVGSDSKEVAELFEKIDGSFCLLWVVSDGTHLHAIGKSLDKSSGQIDSIYSMDKQKIMKFKKGSMVPEVTTFRPFVRPVAKVSSYTGVDSGSALRVATQRWQNNLLKANGMTNGAGTDSTEPTSARAMISGHRRTVPENHIKLLEQWFDLDGDDVVQFEAETWIELKDKQCMVTGKFSHPKWGDSTWPMTLYNVPLVIVNAYCDYQWAVKAKGVTSASWEEGNYGESLALLGELYSYDWRRKG